MRRAVFLDRDNTIIHNDGHLGDPDAARLMDGASDAMILLRDAGFILIVVTNQSGVARGLFTEDDVKAVHQSIDDSITRATGRDDVVLGWYYSPWHPEAMLEAYRGDHPTRKPKPGMFIEAAADHDIDLVNSWMIGDQERDVEAGNAAGCRSVLLNTGATDTVAEHHCPTLTQAARFILAEAGKT